MKIKSRLLLAGAAVSALLLTGCAEYHIRELESAKREGHPFTVALAKEYEALAKKESRVYTDEIDASHFAVKGLQAATGIQVLPEDPRKWDVPRERMDELLDWRERLIFAVHKSGARIAPDLAAQAQVSYDCMLEELEEGQQPDNIAKCEKAFKDMLVEVEKAVHHFTPTFQVYFDLNSAKLSKDAMKMIEEVSDIAKHMNHHTIAITGNADGVGGRKHNLILTQQRAQAVKDALIAHGIDAKKIVAVGGGEVDGPEVAPKNRNVTITLH